MGGKCARATVVACLMLLCCLTALDGLDGGGMARGRPTMLGGEFAGGSGTASDPYLITNVYELQNMSKDLGAHYVLENDIDASATRGWNGGAGFVPVGTTTSWWYRVSFDGRNHTISGLYINRSETYHIGLFGYIKKGIVKDVGLINNNVTGTESVGGLVGWSNEGTVSNCYTTGNVNGYSNVGGLVGYVSTGTVSNCYTTGNVTGSERVGGLVGGFSGTMSNCSATGNVNGSVYVGGLVGISSSNTSNCSATGNVNGTSGVGGLMGLHSDTVSNCSATGSVDGSMVVGGLVGYGYGTVSNCYATGNVNGTSRVGGLVGEIFDEGFSCHGKVSNSHYNIDEVLINGDHYVTLGGLFDDLYADWMDSDMSLDIADYASTLVPNGSYYDIDGIHGLRDLLGFADGSDLQFRLTSDIDLSDSPGLHIPRFSAREFDGNGHVIRNLKLNQTFTWCLGLIGHTWSASIRDLGIQGCSVIGGYNVGGLVGCILVGNVSNCYATGDVNGSVYVGGLVGNAHNGRMSSCYSTGPVTGSDWVGGLVGSSYYWYDVSNCYATGNVSGGNYLGGLMGQTLGNVPNCYATGNVNGTSSVGGLVGYISGTVSDCYATGNVNGTSSVGGLVGSFSGTVSNCYATGKVNGSDNIGGLVGYIEWYGEVSNSFWDTETSGTTLSDGGTGKSTADMKTRKTFTDAGWDFDGVWCILENVTYPLLRWQDVEAPIAHAGPDQTVDEGAFVTFDGSGSSDDLWMADYSWTLTDRGNVTLHGPRPSYRFKNAGTFVVTLNVTDIADKWSIDTLTVTVKDLTPPVAEAGPDQTVDEGSLVTFDGTASRDNLGIVDYTWTFVDGGLIVLHGVHAEHYFDEPGLFVVTLNVTDAACHWGIDSMTVVVNDITPPSANAGPDQTVDAGTLMSFFGGDSYDNDGVANYTWTFMDMVPITLHGERPSYRFYRLGSYLVTMEATDAAGNRAADTMTVTVVDLSPPVADAGPDQAVDEGTVVAFCGDLSSDVIGIVGWTWGFVYDSEEVLLHGMSAIFEFGVPGVYVVTLNVSDAVGNWATDALTVTVRDVTPPVAHAGPDRTVNAGELVTFDGGGSHDNVGVVNYTWTFEQGSEQVLLYGVSPTFTFKSLGVHTVVLRVADATGRWHEDSAVVTVIDVTPPTADAGLDRRVPVGATVALNGSLSSDNVGVATHAWAFTYDGQARTLTGATVLFAFEKSGVYEVVLTVSDVAGNTDEDTIVVTVVGTGTVSGTVLDKGGRPVEGATVRVTAADGSTYNATTAANGTFSLDVPHGAFTWKVGKKGYRSLSGSGSVGPMDTAELDLSGKPLRKEDKEGPGVGAAAALAAMALAALAATSRRCQRVPPWQ